MFHSTKNGEVGVIVKHKGYDQSIDVGLPKTFMRLMCSKGARQQHE